MQNHTKKWSGAGISLLTLLFQGTGFAAGDSALTPNALPISTGRMEALGYDGSTTMPRPSKAGVEKGGENRLDIGLRGYETGPVPAYAGGNYGLPEDKPDERHRSSNIHPSCHPIGDNKDSRVGGTVISGVGSSIGKEPDRNQDPIICPQGHYADGYGYGPIYASGYDDRVTYGTGYGHPELQYVAGEVAQPAYRHPIHMPQPQVMYSYGGGYGYGAPLVTTIVTQGAPSTITTTTYFEE